MSSPHDGAARADRSAPRVGAGSLPWRATLAFMLLPGSVAFAIPLLVLERPDAGASFRPLAAVVIGLGTALLLWCVRDFYRKGKGTLAPWDPPRTLVVDGPYRLSRNPMYVAVLLILIGWAIAFQTRAHVLYVLTMFVVFHVRVRWWEEPFLERTHAQAWHDYKSRVARWLRTPAPP